ncbi:non-homologous end-joining DNA ligase [Nocardioides alkalitolerans]|uniref:non-homologous end-joining DNA ligase n=1 Tax=Nocardioides alkalitolerans TaxID=281714 RepID=UPI000426933A|nr:non-homologous end-joining DNA ligase [Nocardioides alkalitolerans]
MPTSPTSRTGLTGAAGLRPMLATKGTHVPTGEGWSHEVKWDGMRVLAATGASVGAAATPDLRMTSRNENTVTAAYPELHGLPAAVDGRHAVLDGEVVAFADGLPSFSALADRMHVREPRRAARLATTNPVTFLVFDLLRLDGRDLTSRPLAERRALLADVLAVDDRWQVPPAYDDGAMLLEATDQQGLEGIVSKRLDSPYAPGTRSRHWLKFPHRRRASYVVGGWRPETGSEHRLGALLVGTPTPGGLLYRGRVGSGIAGKVGPVLAELLAPLAATRSPFADEVPRIDATGTRWVHPQLVVDVESLGVNGDPTVSGSRLRQPSYRGVRTDLDLGDL